MGTYIVCKHFDVTKPNTSEQPTIVAKVVHEDNFMNQLRGTSVQDTMKGGRGVRRGEMEGCGRGGIGSRGGYKRGGMGGEGTRGKMGGDRIEGRVQEGRDGRGQERWEGTGGERWEGVLGKRGYGRRDGRGQWGRGGMGTGQEEEQETEGIREEHICERKYAQT